MHSYTIDVAAYDGSSPRPDPNQPQADPWVWIHGTVDGKSAGYVPVFWSAIQRWNTVGGVQGVQNFLASLLLGCVTGPPFSSAPVLPTIPASIPAPVTGGSKSVVCTQGLVAP